MSQENVDLARRCAQAWNDRNWSAIPDLFDPVFELDLSRNIFNPAVYHGPCGNRAMGERGGRNLGRLFLAVHRTHRCG